MRSPLRGASLPGPAPWKHLSTAAGWLGFYSGKTPDECRRANTIPDAITLQWLELFRRRSPGGTIRSRPKVQQPGRQDGATGGSRK